MLKICDGCPRRRPLCHQHCEAFLAENQRSQALRELVKQAQRAEREKDAFCAVVRYNGIRYDRHYRARTKRER